MRRVSLLKFTPMNTVKPPQVFCKALNLQASMCVISVQPRGRALKMAALWLPLPLHLHHYSASANGAANLLLPYGLHSLFKGEIHRLTVRLSRAAHSHSNPGRLRPVFLEVCGGKGSGEPPARHAEISWSGHCAQDWKVAGSNPIIGRVTLGSSVTLGPG